MSRRQVAVICLCVVVWVYCWFAVGIGIGLLFPPSETAPPAHQPPVTGEP